MLLRNRRNLWWLIALFSTKITDQVPIQTGVLPEFLAPLENLTVTQGRDAHFTCVVNNLGDYRVAWIKSDSKAILAIHSNMVALNSRLSVTYNGHNTWKLHLSNVQFNDSGTFMCQVNTDPMMSQMGFLEVVVPPDILNDDHDSAGGEALEGGTIRLRCSATGVPTPNVTWKRHGSRDIIFRHDTGKNKIASATYDGEILQLSHIQREDSGAYYCIASNGVPPSISKRYHVHVHFAPLVKLTNQLVAAPVGSDVQIQCYVESSPNAMNSWFRDNGDKLLDVHKYKSSETSINDYSLYMNLTIRSLEKRDFGGYVCSSVNALGKAEGSLRLQELQLPPESMPTLSYLPKFTTISKTNQKKPLPDSDQKSKLKGKKITEKYPKEDVVTIAWEGTTPSEGNNHFWYSNTPPWSFSGSSSIYNTMGCIVYLCISLTKFVNLLL